MKKAIEIVKVILDKESRGWYLTYKDRLIAELKGKHGAVTLWKYQVQTICLNIKWGFAVA